MGGLAYIGPVPQYLPLVCCSSALSEPTVYVLCSSQINGMYVGIDGTVIVAVGGDQACTVRTR